MLRLKPSGLQTGTGRQLRSLEDVPLNVRLSLSRDSPLTSSLFSPPLIARADFCWMVIRTGAITERPITP